MSELKPRITENGIDYILVGDYYIPDLKLPEEHRPIGKYGRLHREYLREIHPARLNTLTLTGELWTYVLERGVTIYEYRTERKEIVIYAVLRDIIGIISDTFICDSHVDEKGYLHFTENVSNYRKKITDEAFSLMGEPYNEWNRQGISIWDFNRSFAGE